MRLLRPVCLAGVTVLVTGAIALQAQPAQPPAPAATTAKADPRLDRLKAAVAADVKSPAMFTFGQQMNDMVFSFAELGFQEYETQKYLTGILEKEGFTIERGIGGIPTAWVARWGSGSPVKIGRASCRERVSTDV